MPGVVVVNQPGVYLVDADGNNITVTDGLAIGSAEAILLAGKDGTDARLVRVASDGTVRVDPTGTTTQPVSVASLPLPTGAATEATVATLATAANQTNGNQITIVRSEAKGTSVSAGITSNPIDANTEALHVDGSNVTQPISAAALPLPAGAATSANQTNGQQVAIIRSGNKGTSAAYVITSTPVDANTEALHVSPATLAPDASTETTLAAILVDTGQIEALLTTIDADTSNLDVALSTRATEATLDLVRVAVQSLDTDFDVALSTRASAANQTNKAQYTRITDGTNDVVVDASGDLQVIHTDALPVGSNLIGKVQIRDPGNTVDLGDTTNPLRVNATGNNSATGNITALNGVVEVDTNGSAGITASVMGTWVGTLVGEATIDGTTWFTIAGFQIGGSGVVTSTTQNGNFRANVEGFRKMRIRASAWTSGTANIVINSSVRIGQIPIDGNGNIGVRVVSTAPPAGVDAVIIAADTPLTVGSHDTNYIIPNGETFFLQQLTGGNEDPSKGAKIEVIYYDGTTEHIVHRDYFNGATHSTIFPDVAVARDGTPMVGDGSTKVIRIRRSKFSGTDIAIDGVVYGYTQ